nr:GDP-mannose 4,6-dehydratase [Acidimicrobiales bacterium]
RQTGSYGMVVPRFVEQALANEPITIYGDGTQTRCFCAVGDIVDGIVVLSETPDAIGRVFNLGGVEEVSIQGLAETVIAITGSSSRIEFVSYDEAYEEGFEDMQRRVPDTTRARELVGFAPTASLDDIIRMVVEAQGV